MTDVNSPEEMFAVPPVDPSTVLGANGAKLAAYEWGNPRGKEILFVHGLAQCHLCFAPQIDSELAKEFRLVAYDLRGHGSSEKPLGDADYNDGTLWAQDLAAVLDAKALHRPVVVGWSLGGRVLRQYLMAYGDQRLGGINFVGSRVIEDPGYVGSRAPMGIKLSTLSPGQRIDQAIAFLDACYQIKPASRLYERALCYNMLTPFSVRDAITSWSTDVDATLAALRQVRVPTLITQGTHDVIVHPDTARAIARAIPHAQLSWFEGVGHSPFQEDVHRFNRELVEFVRAAR